jgi:DNA-binding protein HU-beta
MATRLIQQIRKEIDQRRAELEALENALSALEGGGLVGNGLRASSGGKKTRRPRTPEQKAAQAKRMKEIWAAKKAGKRAPAKKTSAKKAPAKKAGRKSLAKKVAESSAPKAE